jgi:hypothetical protein
VKRIFKLILESDNLSDYCPVGCPFLRSMDNTLFCIVDPSRHPMRLAMDEHYETIDNQVTIKSLPYRQPFCVLEVED